MPGISSLVVQGSLGQPAVARLSSARIRADGSCVMALADGELGN